MCAKKLLSLDPGPLKESLGLCKQSMGLSKRSMGICKRSLGTCKWIPGRCKWSLGACKWSPIKILNFDNFFIFELFELLRKKIIFKLHILHPGKKIY